MKFIMKKNQIKYTFFSSICLLFLTSTFSQDIIWEKSYGGKQADYLMDVQPTADYGFILAGSSLSTKSGNKTEDNNGDLDYWIWKMDEKGDLDWQKNFGGSGSDFLQSIALTKDGGFILAGNSSSDKDFDKKENCRGIEDFWIIKLDAKGNEEWQKTIGGSGQDKLKTVKQTNDGGYIIGGSSSSFKSDEKSENGYGNTDYWIVKLDKNGVVKWQKTFGGIYNDEFKSLETCKDGGYLIGGNSNSPMSGSKTHDNIGINDYWIIKIDKDGMEQWQKSYGGDNDDQLSVVKQTIDGNFIIAGNSNSDASDQKSKNNEKGTDFWILKIDVKGEIIWQETYNIDNVDLLSSVIENQDRSLLMSGFSQGKTGQIPESSNLKKVKDDKNTNDYVAIKISENGEEIWRKIIGSSGEDLLNKTIETRDGGYLLAGTSNAKVSGDKKSNIGSNDFWVVKLLDKNKPEKIKLGIEAFPNPTQAFVNVIIGYDFDHGTATLYDLSGRQLQKTEISSRTIPMDLSSYPEGIYIVNIDTNVQHDGVKIIKQSIKN